MYDRDTRPTNVGSWVRVYMEDDGSRRARRCNGKAGLVVASECSSDGESGPELGSPHRMVYRVAVAGAKAFYWFERHELEALADKPRDVDVRQR